MKEFLGGLPGGFWTQFIVVMLVIFLLGFFLDFIEIAVVVVPIVAPILLADPAANITAVWLGVMVGLNIQTSFLTPPFGFALFYLRGVAPPSVRTLQIYRGASAFILLQLVGLAIAGAAPSLVNYLPYRTYLTSETAPPPMNPRLQYCLEENLFEYYDTHWEKLSASIVRAKGLDIGYLPPERRDALTQSFDKAAVTYELVDRVRSARSALADYAGEYRPLHQEVRRIEAQIRSLDDEIEERERDLARLGRSEEASYSTMEALRSLIESHETQKRSLQASIPERWQSLRSGYLELAEGLRDAQLAYRRNVDESYEVIAETRRMITQSETLKAIGNSFAPLELAITTEPTESTMDAIKALEQRLGELDGVSAIKTPLAKARRQLKGGGPDREQALFLLNQGRERFQVELAWRTRALGGLSVEIEDYERSIRDSIGLRRQTRMSVDQAKAVARCQANHRDISLNF